MNEQEIAAYAALIRPRDRAVEAQAKEILDNKVKPVGSLGVLEALAAQLAGIYGSLEYDTSPKADVIFCADNGVYDEGYHPYPQPISRLVAEIMGRGRGGGAVLARAMGAAVSIVNLGLKGGALWAEPLADAGLAPSPAGCRGDRYLGQDVPAHVDLGQGVQGQEDISPGHLGQSSPDHRNLGQRNLGQRNPGRVSRSQENPGHCDPGHGHLGQGNLGQAAGDIQVASPLICPQGAGNIARGPALTREQVCQAVSAGIAEAERLIAGGVRVLAAGEIGLGNTTTAAAVLAAFTGSGPAEVTGMGSGTVGPALERKIAAVAQALDINRPDSADVFDVLAKVGGLDIAALAGLYLACGRRRIPAVLDGFVSLAAALCALRFTPAVQDYLILSHHSAEKAAGLATAALGLEPGLDRPPLRMEMRLGEGTGAVLMFPLLDGAAQILREMASFDDLDRWFPGWREW